MQHAEYFLAPCNVELMSAHRRHIPKSPLRFLSATQLSYYNGDEWESGGEKRQRREVVVGCRHGDQNNNSALHLLLDPLGYTHPQKTKTDNPFTKAVNLTPVQGRVWLHLQNLIQFLFFNVQSLSGRDSCCLLDTLQTDL